MILLFTPFHKLLYMNIYYRLIAIISCFLFSTAKKNIVYK